MTDFWSPLVHQLSPYVPGEQPKIEGLIKLNTNENPFPPSPKVAQAIEMVLKDQAQVLRLYPDPEASELKAQLAQYHGITSDCVFVGNGSDEVLAHIFAAFFCKSKPILFPDITYSFYEVYCQLYQVAWRTVALDADFTIKLTDYTQDNDGIILANPNAPTGVIVPISDIELLLQQQLKFNPQAVVVIDEAYIDFGGQSAVTLINTYPNVVVCQTFSKSRALAGLRVGMAFAQPKLIDALGRIKNSFNSYPLDRMALAGATASLQDEAYFQRMTQHIIELREWLIVQLEQLGFKVLPSHANFVFVTHERFSATQLALQLREQRILVRHFTKPRIESFLRITIGQEHEQQALVEALHSIMH